MKGPFTQTDEDPGSTEYTDPNKLKEVEFKKELLSQAGESQYYDDEPKVEAQDQARKGLAEGRVYIVKAVLHLKDGINQGNLNVHASSEDEARKIAVSKLCATWRISEKEIDIIEIRKR